jgi:hypothetical protein
MEDAAVNYAETLMLPDASCVLFGRRMTNRVGHDLRIPDIHYPWSGACSPHAPFVEARMRTWLEHYHLLPNERYRTRIARARLGRLASRCHPYAPIERLQIIAQFYAWYFLIDDRFVSHARAISRHALSTLTAIVDVLDFDRIGAAPVYGEAAWLELCQQMKQYMSNEQFERFAHDMRVWIGMAALRLSKHSHTPGTQERPHETLQRHTDGMYPCLDVVDFATGLPLTPEEYHRLDVQQLRRHTNHIVCWSSDLRHLAVEIRQPERYENLLAIYTCRGYSLQASVDHVSERIGAEIDAFVRMAARAREIASPALLHYVDGMERWMAGYLEWIARDRPHRSGPITEPDTAIAAW